MSSTQEIKLILEEALKKEKDAEILCEEILKYAHLNGFSQSVEHIKNDEIHHQKMVQQIIKLLKY